MRYGSAARFTSLLWARIIFLERPPLTGALVFGALFLLKRSRKPHLSAAERQHALDLSEAQRTSAEKMYDPPSDDERAAPPWTRK